MVDLNGLMGLIGAGQGVRPEKEALLADAQMRMLKAAKIREVHLGTRPLPNPPKTLREQLQQETDEWLEGVL